MSKNRKPTVDIKRGEADFLAAIVIGLLIGTLIKQVRLGLLLGLIIGLGIVFLNNFRAKR